MSFRGESRLFSFSITNLTSDCLKQGVDVSHRSPVFVKSLVTSNSTSDMMPPSSLKEQAGSQFV
jgi:hypothetical protein